MWERGDIYKANYEGWYCVDCEEYKDEADMEPGARPLRSCLPVGGLAAGDQKLCGEPATRCSAATPLPCGLPLGPHAAPACCGAAHGRSLPAC